MQSKLACVDERKHKPHLVRSYKIWAVMYTADATTASKVIAVRFKDWLNRKRKRK